MLNPIVITSRRANEHLDDIKSQHADILQGIQDQSMRVTQFNAERDAKLQMDAENAQKVGLERERMTMDSDSKKMELENKRRELEIKAQALTQT